MPRGSTEATFGCGDGSWAACPCQLPLSHRCWSSWCACQWLCRFSEMTMTTCVALQRPNRAMQPRCANAIRTAHPQIASDAKKSFRIAMLKHIHLIWYHRKMPGKKPAKILRCWPAMRKIGVFFKTERCEIPAIRTPAAVWACDAGARNAKSLAMWVERCEPLSLQQKNLHAPFLFSELSANKGLPLPLGRGVCKTKSKKWAPQTQKTLHFQGFLCSEGFETMVSEGARPWGGGRSGDCEINFPKRTLTLTLF